MVFIHGRGLLLIWIFSSHPKLKPFARVSSPAGWPAVSSAAAHLHHIPAAISSHCTLYAWLNGPFETPAAENSRLLWSRRLTAMQRLPSLCLSCLLSHPPSHEAASCHIRAPKHPGQRSRTQRSHLSLRDWFFFPDTLLPSGFGPISVSEVTCGCFVSAPSSSSSHGFHRMWSICGSAYVTRLTWQICVQKWGCRAKVVCFYYPNRRAERVAMIREVSII